MIKEIKIENFNSSIVFIENDIEYKISFNRTYSVVLNDDFIKYRVSFFKNNLILYSGYFTPFYNMLQNYSVYDDINFIMIYDKKLSDSNRNIYDGDFDNLNLENIKDRYVLIYTLFDDGLERKTLYEYFNNKGLYEV